MVSNFGNYGNTIVMQSQSAKLPAIASVFPSVIQSAHADSSFTFNDNLVNDCVQFGAGVNNEDCDITVAAQIDPGTQDPPTGTSNLYDVIINTDGLNDCDEFDDGDNNVDCNLFANYLVGPVSQTNTPNVNPVGTNEIDIVTDDNMLNSCDEAGSGNNEAFCEITAFDITNSISQANFVASSDGIGSGFVESNTINALQGLDQINTCDEEGGGSSVPICDSQVANIIGPVDVSNDVEGFTPDTVHNNNLEVSQFGAGRNDCDEEGAGNGANIAVCHNVDDSNVIDSVVQDNEANGADNAAQTNDFSIAQAFDVKNDCNEFEEGDNLVFCNIEDADNFVGPVAQGNFAIGSPGADISQHNDIDGNDVDGIPGISQVILAANTCGQTGSGDNLALCDIVSTNNIIDSIAQSNFVSNADDGTVYIPGQWGCNLSSH